MKVEKLARVVLAVLVTLGIARSTSAFSGAGSGTESDPYVITNVQQLQEMANDVNVCYALGNDIDASETQTWNGGAGFEPITDVNGFTGKFDGRGHVISGLYINRPGTDGVGLFAGVLGAEITNVGLADVDITGRMGVGALASYTDNATTVFNCWSTGSVQSAFVGANSSGVGGLLGANNGYSLVSQCRSSANVSLPGASQAGGLSGRNHRGGIIEDSYATGNVTAISKTGGLLGDNQHGEYGTLVRRCYSTGRVTGSGGGLIGYNHAGGMTEDSYWDKETSGKTTSSGGTPKTTAEMKQEATFVAWDFVNTWDIVENETYPFFREAPIPTGVFYVDGANGSDDNDGLSLETAFATIQKGVDEANDADTIVVYPAVYTEPVDFDGKAITVQGVATEAGAPIVETPMDYAFSFYTDEEPNSVLKNFVVRNSYLALFLIDSAPTIRNLTIVDNWMGMEAYAGSEPDISNCIFYNNTNGDLSGCQARYSFVHDEITDGLVAHWKFDEGGGDTAYDSAGNNDGTIHGAVPTASQIDGALQFDGADDYVEIPDSLSMRTIDGSSADYTIGVWVNTTQPGAAPWGQVTIFDRRSTPALSGKDHWVANIFLNEYNAVSLFIDDIDDLLFLNDTMAINDGRWHHITATRKNTEYIRIYVDGDLRQSGATAINPSTTEVTTIGVRRNNNNVYKGYFDGIIDDVRIYNRALSAEEIQQLYQYGPGPMFADTNSGDYHLLSERGRYWPEHDVWVLDEATSPCVDGGDPNDNPADERMPNGGRINMGAYGGTAYASMSEWPLKSDMDRDGRVSMKDFAILGGEWLEELGWLE